MYRRAATNANIQYMELKYHIATFKVQCGISIKADMSDHCDITMRMKADRKHSKKDDRHARFPESNLYSKLSKQSSNPQ